MASYDDEFSPSNKRARMDPIKNDESTGHTDESTAPSSLNLEHFPIEILLRIFADTNDIDLLNLAATSCRFEKIAKVVFADRYANKYFTIDNECKGQQDIDEELLSCFGGGVSAIQAIDVRGIDRNHWMAQMIHKHIGHRLQKLHFHKCTFRNGCDMLANHMNITHLTIFYAECDDNHWIHLPRYQNLRKLELRSTFNITALTIDWILRNNPQLERLILHHASYDFSLAKIMEYVNKRLMHLKEFIVMGYGHGLDDFPAEEHLQKFFNVTNALESFGFTIHTQNMDLFQRLDSNCCKTIKHLELLHIHNNVSNTEFNQAMQIASTFKNVETLSLHMNYFYHDTAPILALIASLPNLRRLHIPQMERNISDWVLRLLQTGEHLEKLVISIGDGRSEMRPDGYHHHINAQFHSEIMNVKRKRSIEIEFMENGRAIGRVTAKEIIWKNKLVHWIGYDPIYSNSNVNLLDLADQKKAHSKQKSPFDSILDHLDLDSLYALHQCSTRSKQLVDDYVRRHSEHGGIFTITDEFFLNCSTLHQFASYVKSLEVKIDCSTSFFLKYTIGMYYKNLTKLYFSTRYRINPYEFLLPNVQHYIFYGTECRFPYYCNLIDFVEKYDQLKIIEFKTVVDLQPRVRDRDGSQPSIPNLQTFKFKPKNEDQAKFVRELFAKNDIEIVEFD